MSLAKYSNAELCGYGYPWLPKELKCSLSSLNIAFEKAEPTILQLTSLGDQFDGFYFSGRYSPVTSDGYEWFCCLELEQKRNFENDAVGRVVILFPYPNDYDRLNGSKLDRSIAIHKKGAVSENGVEVVLQHLIRELNKIHRRKGVFRYFRS